MFEEVSAFVEEYRRTHYPSADASSRRLFDERVTARVEIVPLDGSGGYSEIEPRDILHKAPPGSALYVKIEITNRWGRVNRYNEEWTEPWATYQNYVEYFQNFKDALRERWPRSLWGADHEMDRGKGFQIDVIEFWLP